ncbi:MAG TPA: 50S ribosomal protein L9 [Herpetosiphonaceae bacterium]|jgi:large subunit ribosomal protein L9|nr:50S ribosomal protein L9 [Herpetosiphonaceae bacterium]
MKIVLMKDVPNLGAAGEVKEVADGYARNYLMPKGFAALATKGLIKQAQERAEAQRKRDLRARTDAEALAQRINGQTVRFTARVGELDRLYGSITNVDIAEKLSSQIGAEIDRRRVELGDPIKRAGVYSVVVDLGHGLDARINVVVEGEGSEAPATESTPADVSAEEAAA